MTTTTAPAALDEQAVEAFAGRLIGLYTGGMLTYMIDIGERTGLLAALADGPATSDELATRAGLQERYVREWLGALATGLIADYDPATRTYSLPTERAVCLAGAGAMNLAPVAQLNTHLAKHVAAVARAFREGGGVPYDDFRPEFTDVMHELSRGVFDGLLVDAIVPLVPGLTAALTGGARLADVCCGTGHSLIVLGQAFPASTFVGYDMDEESIDRGRTEAVEAGLGNVSFEVCDVARLTVAEPFDAVVVFNAIHDQLDPAGVLRSIHAALAPGGALMIDEPRVSSNLEDNIGNPFAPFTYAVSTLHCLTVSLAHGGAGLGTAWGEQLACRMLADAGFGDVTVHDAPGDPTNAVFVTRKRSLP